MREYLVRDARCAMRGARCAVRAQSIGQNSPLARAAYRRGNDRLRVQEILVSWCVPFAFGFKSLASVSRDRSADFRRHSHSVSRVSPVPPNLGARDHYSRIE